MSLIINKFATSSQMDKIAFSLCNEALYETGKHLFQVLGSLDLIWGKMRNVKGLKILSNIISILREKALGEVIDH